MVIFIAVLLLIGFELNRLQVKDTVPTVVKVKRIKIEHPAEYNTRKRLKPKIPK